MKKTRLALKETFRMKRVSQLQQLIVEMMTELVQNSPEKRAKGDDLFVPSGTHPDGDSCPLTTLRDLIQAVKLPPGIARAYCKYFNDDRRHVQAIEEAIGELANQAFDFDAIFLFESLLEPSYDNLQSTRTGKSQMRDVVALAINGLIACFEFRVIGVRQNRIPLWPNRGLRSRMNPVSTP